MKQKSNVTVSKKREVKTYVHMWHTSDVLLEKGIENEKGSLHQFMASLVFTAFTLEASLNHIGRKIFNCWDDLENLSPKSKLSVISEKLGIKITYGARPWQILNNLFRFRNDVAHGKSENITQENSMPLGKFNDTKFGEKVATRWENYCTKKNAIEAREDTEKIIKILYEACSFEDDFPFSSGLQHGSATFLQK